TRPVVHTSLTCRPSLWLPQTGWVVITSSILLRKVFSAQGGLGVYLGNLLIARNWVAYILAGLGMPAKFPTINAALTSFAGPATFRSRMGHGRKYGMMTGRQI